MSAADPREAATGTATAAAPSEAAPPEEMTPDPEAGAAAAAPKRAKSGVVYVSRVPPGLDVGGLRALLRPVGELGRVWLRAEDAARRKEREALGGARRRGVFMDGWVEFVRRRDARACVELLNGRAMRGGKRPGRWAGDLWCLRYLRGFTWDDLVEECCGGARERVLRVRREMEGVRRERAFLDEAGAFAERLGIQGGAAEGRRPRTAWKQKRVVGADGWEDDADERRAAVAQVDVDAEVDGGGGAAVDPALAAMLFRKKRRRLGE